MSTEPVPMTREPACLEVHCPQNSISWLEVVLRISSLSLFVEHNICKHGFLTHQQHRDARNTIE